VVARRLPRQTHVRIARGRRRLKIDQAVAECSNALGSNKASLLRDEARIYREISGILAAFGERPEQP
jgi:hypothetical protein